MSLVYLLNYVVLNFTHINILTLEEIIKALNHFIQIAMLGIFRMIMLSQTVLHLMRA